MKVEKAGTYFFEVEGIRQEFLIEGLDFFVDRLNKVGATVDSIYPGDPFALPFCMYLSDKLSVPIKTEQFLKEEERVLVLFSFFYKDLITRNYIYEKLKIFRKRFPRSPSLLLASDLNVIGADVQLIKFHEFTELFSYRFRREAYRNYFYPIEGEITHFTEEFWALAKEEIRLFEKAKRIRDNAKRFLKEEKEKLKFCEPDPEIVLWERFVKFSFVELSREEVEKEPIKLKLEKLIQVEDRRTNSAVTSLLEYISQVFEAHFPTYLAYSNLEVVDRRGVTIIPKVSEVMDGADLRFEIVLESEFLERDYKKLLLLLKDSLKAVFSEIFEKEAFRPVLDSVVDKEAGRASVYVNWFLDKEMVERLLKKINRKWLLSRLLYRKRFKSQMREFLKFLEEFTFTPEALDTLFAHLEALWKQNPSYVRLYGKEIKELLDEKELWPVIGYYGVKLLGTKSKLLSSLVSFLLSLKGYENVHHLLAEEKVFFVPVKAKRILRANWERVIREGQKVFLKHEPLNPNSPVTYTVMSEDGKFLGVLPETFSHYVFAWENSGKSIVCERLYFDPDIFSETSYWVRLECR